MPHSSRVEAYIAYIVEVGELNFVPGGEGNSPKQPNRIQLLRRAKVNNYPLRVLDIELAGEVLVQIRIALPVTCCVTVVKARIALVISLVDGISAARKLVAIRDQDRIVRFVV